MIVVSLGLTVSGFAQRGGSHGNVVLVLVLVLWPALEAKQGH